MIIIIMILSQIQFIDSMRHDLREKKYMLKLARPDPTAKNWGSQIYVINVASWL